MAGRLRRRWPTRPLYYVYPYGIRRKAPAAAPRDTPPSYGTPAQTAWTTNTTPKSTTVGGTNGAGSLSWDTGDYVVVLGGSAANGTVMGTPTGPASLDPFTPLGSAQSAAGTCWGHRWVAVANAPGSGTISVSRTGNTDNYGAVAWTVAGSDGVDFHAAAASLNVKVQSATRSDSHDAVFVLVLDFGAAGTTGLGWTPAGQSQQQALDDGTNYTVFAADWPDEAAAGTTSYGITGTPSTDQHTRVVVAMLGTTATGGTTHTADAPLDVTATLTTAAESAKPADASLAATATLTGATTVDKPAAASLAATATLSAAGLADKPAAASLAATATLATAATVTSAGVSADASLAVTATLTAVATRQALPAAALPVTATLATVATVTKPADAGLAATAALTAAASRTAASSLALAATATLSAASTKTALPAAALAVTATLAADATVGAAPVLASASLAVTATLATGAVRTAVGAASLPVTATLATASSRQVFPAASLSATATLSAGAVAAYGVALSLAVSAVLSASAAVIGAVPPLVPRPSAGTVARPASAALARPFAGVVPRP